MRYLVIFIAFIVIGCSNRTALSGKFEYKNSLNNSDVSKIKDKRIHAILTRSFDFLGNKYSYGGSNPEGFDCSGFVHYLFEKEANIQLPRTSYEQSLIPGKNLLRSELKLGDLVFFKTTRKKIATHVGIYIGENQFIHSANKRYGVRVDRLDIGYWGNKYSGAKRVIYN